MDRDEGEGGALERTRLAATTASLLAALLFGVLPLTQAGPAPAQICPQDICACVGDAGRFDLVGTKVDVSAGKVRYSGYSYPIPGNVDSSVCATTGRFSGISGGESMISGDIICTLPPDKTAVTLRGYKYYGYPQPGVSVGGDIATGGGAIKGMDFALVTGITDTTGTHPRVASCQQAVVDAQAASATLKALAPAQDLGELIIEAGNSHEIYAGPGVQVINATKIRLKSKKYYGYPIGAALNINLSETTESVIVNVAEQLSVGKECNISVAGGDPSAVIINVHGPKAKVQIGKGASVDPAILAPTTRTLNVPQYATVGNLFGTKIRIKGAEVVDALLCP